MTHGSAVGTGGGAIAGFVKAAISVGLTLDTVYYAAIGALVGLAINEIYQHIKAKIKK